MSTSGSKSNEHVAHFLVDIHSERTNLQKWAKNKRTTISNDTLIVLTANQGL